MSKRTFLVQRYCQDNWMKVFGLAPFLATGPNFASWVIPGSLERFGEHRFHRSFILDIDSVLGDSEALLARESAATMLLSLGIVQAMWAIHSTEPLPDGPAWVEWRWEAAVRALSDEIPPGPIGSAVVELLSGMSGPEHYRSYMSEDEIPFEVTAPRPVTP